MVREDTNYYRKVSKYDLDRYSVNWRELMIEKERQATENTKRNKQNVENSKAMGKNETLLKKI